MHVHRAGGGKDAHPCTFILLGWWKEIHPAWHPICTYCEEIHLHSAHPYFLWCKKIHPARPYCRWLKGKNPQKRLGYMILKNLKVNTRGGRSAYEFR
jgi:hypothetical protein